MDLLLVFVRWLVKKDINLHLFQWADLVLTRMRLFLGPPVSTQDTDWLHCDEQQDLQIEILYHSKHVYLFFFFTDSEEKA